MRSQGGGYHEGEGQVYPEGGGLGVYHEWCGRKAAEGGQEGGIIALEAQMKQVGFFLEGGRVGADFSILVGRQDTPGEVDCIAVHIRDAFHPVPQGDLLQGQRRAGRAGFKPPACDRQFLLSIVLFFGTVRGPGSIKYTFRTEFCMCSVRSGVLALMITSSILNSVMKV